VWSSRYWVERRRWDFSRSEEASVAFLLDLGARIEAAHGARPMLLTTADWVAIFIERNGHRLQSQFVFPQPLQPVIRALANKWKMHLLAIEQSIPTPLTTYPATRADVEEFLDTAGLPIIMKPADPYLGDLPPKRIMHARHDVLDEAARALARGPLNFVLQEYIPGDADSVWMCNGYFGHQHSVVFTGRKLRQVSPTGIASLAVCLPNETVASQTRNFMEGIGYRGCVGIGFRYDRRDGTYKVLDVNARVSGICRLFAGTNEMDVVRACYLDLTGQDVPATELQPGRKWMHEQDIVAAVPAIGKGNLSAKEWMRSVRGVEEMQWFATDDPVPVLMWLRQKVRYRTRIILRHLVGR
jgi:D-aspartate ligase